MGRSRAVPNPADDDAYQRSKRRRAASSGENFETMATVPGTSDGKKVLYHCNYCNKDISGKIRMKCTKCADFDLCLECFSVGAEVAPHKSNHPYRVMDSLSFPLICPDWNADEEILLLEGMEMYGLGNWAEIAEHVGTKNKAQCIDHYMTAYLNSPCYPLPDMSHVNGKNRKDLLAMAKVEDECKKGISVFGNITQKAECLFSPSRVKLENLNREAPAGRSSSILTAASGANKKASNMGQFNTDNDGTKVEDLTSSQDPCMDRSVGVKKPKYSGDQGPSMAELSGYNPWRHEFDPEYDDDAEQALAEMEFKESDSETERELKLRVLHIYLSRLNERKRRKDFILERNLLYPKPLEKELSSEDREIYQRYKVFMCFQSQEEHEALVQSALEERRIRRRIQELQECRAAGCRTLAEAKIYSEQKRKRDSEASAQQGKEGSQVVVSKASAKANRGMNREKGGCDGIVQNTLDNHKMKGGSGLETSDEDTTSIITGQTTTRSLDDWDITGLPAADLLSKAEQQLCCQNRLLPSHYLQIQEVLTREILKGTIVERSDAHGFFEVDPSKVDLIFDIVNKKVGPACLI